MVSANSTYPTQNFFGEQPPTGSTHQVVSYSNAQLFQLLLIAQQLLQSSKGLSSSKQKLQLARMLEENVNLKQGLFLLLLWDMLTVKIHVTGIECLWEEATCRLPTENLKQWLSVSTYFCCMQVLAYYHSAGKVHCTSESNKSSGSCA